jgi:DNA-binding winged helix-turn-helix (wHTH) protein/predicted ATPase
VSYSFGDFEVDAGALELREKGVAIQVKPKVLGVLVYLLRNRDRVVSHQELLDAVWSGVNVSPNSLAQAIAAIRRHLRDGGDEIIRTVHSRGYRFVAAVEQRRDISVDQDGAQQSGFVGRAEVMGRLLARLEAARASRGGICLITGPPGIGKTRVIGELARIAEARGLTVHRARCYEDGEIRALSLWRDLVGSSVDPSLLSELKPEADPFRAFERLRAWAQRQARSRPPLVLALDDLNWADAPSLLALKFLVRDIESTPLLIVAAYRDAPIAPELARVLGSVCRVDPTRRIELEALDLAATSDLAREIAGAGLSHELVEHLWHKTDGNPLFLTQMLHVVAMEEIQGPVSRLTSTLLGPETVREAIAAHLEALSPACRDMLSVAAVVGLRFDLDLLAPTMGAPTVALMERLDEACRARIIAPVASSNRTFEFLHRVVRDVLYRKLGLLDRMRWHRAAGDASAALYDAGTLDDPNAALEHWVRGAPAGDVDGAISWVARTLQRLRRSGDREAAIVLLERAWQLGVHAHAVKEQTFRVLLDALSECLEGDPDNPRLKEISEKFQRRTSASS